MSKEKMDLAEIYNDKAALQKALFDLRDVYKDRMELGLPNEEIVEQQRIIAAMLNFRILPVGGG